MINDIRIALRNLIRVPGFALAFVLTLGLGIGANVTIFSWIDSSLRRQMRGVVDANRFVALNGTTRTRSDLPFSYPDVVDYRARRPDSHDDGDATEQRAGRRRKRASS